MEWGPRALGNRSILAAATSQKMQDIINAKVKHREMFRPFAPVILREYTKKYFITDKNISISTDYMLLVYPFRSSVKSKIPAVVHVDGTGRLQTIDEISNPKYYQLIKAYSQKTGIPLILNTSFNVKGEPIVCTPQDAIKCFLHTEIDYLVLDNYLIKK
jgi:carbamoyltransferase